MLGVSSIAVAVALPPILARADSPVPSPAGLCLRDNTRLAVDRTPLTASFVDPGWNPVGPSFAIPPDWWEISNGVARMRNAIECPNWSGPTCWVSGLAFYRGAECVLRDTVNFDGGGPAAAIIGGEIIVSRVELRVDGLPCEAANEGLRAVLL
jgi:hypothetical protein